MGSHTEVDRIIDAYRGYLQDPQKMSQWGANNLGNHAIIRERNLAVTALLQRNKFLPLHDKRLLDIGCGSGANLARFLTLGALAPNLYGIDLLPDRIEAAKLHYPRFHLNCRNAENLPYPDQAFDLVLVFTLFSSILDPNMQLNVAREAARVLKRDGCILWYDLRYNNPSNPNVRKVSRHELQNLFPGFKFSGKTLTLLPPLARKLGSATPLLYPLLSRVPFLRTHNLGILRRRLPC